jgi:hypothetical protein
MSGYVSAAMVILAPVLALRNTDVPRLRGIGGLTIHLVIVPPRQLTSS